VPPGDPEAIVEAMQRIVAGDRSARYDDPQSWEATSEAYAKLIDRIATHR
jgi:hypothetical protein